MSCERPSHKEAYVGIFLVADPSEAKCWGFLQDRHPARSLGQIKDVDQWLPSVTRVPVMLFFKLFFSLFVFLFSAGTIKLLFFIQISTTGEKSGNNEHTPVQSRLRESPNPSPTFCAKMRAFVARLRHWYTAVWPSYIVFPTALFRLCTDVKQKVEQKGSH